MFNLVSLIYLFDFVDGNAHSMRQKPVIHTIQIANEAPIFVTVKGDLTFIYEFISSLL